MHYDPTDLAKLRFATQTFDDIQRLRIVCSNRAGAANRAAALLDVRQAETIAAGLHSAETAARLAVAHAYRTAVSPAVRGWQRSTRGVGEHLLALLLAEIGDPFVAVPRNWEGEATDDAYERTLPDLWAYCGLAAGRRRRVGMSEAEAHGLGRPRAKRTLRLLAEAQLKSGGPHRGLYDSERAKAAAKGWTDAKGHTHALRVVAKRLLRDVWRVRRDEYRATAVEVAA